jgi:sigma-B regulation protein RsbU (phosphoserine phosphatase)
MKILIAEDDAVSRRRLEMTLTKQGHEVRSVPDGLEAWEIWKQEEIPVVISDWIMPGADGLALCRMIRGMHRGHYTYVVMLTSLEGKTNYLEAMEAGADDFLNKPFDEEQLAARLKVAERILGLRQHVNRLEGLLPICSYCKKIRDEQNTWKQMESYISRRSEARFSHSICPECFEKVVRPQLEA